MRGHVVVLTLTAVFCLALSCEVVHPPNCSRQVPGSLHPHNRGCHLFYRCDELGEPRAFACPPGTRFLNRGGKLCAPEFSVPCNRCPRSAMEETECGLPITPPPCMTSTRPPPTSSTPSPPPPSSTTPASTEATTVPLTAPTTERFTPTFRTTELVTSPAPTSPSSPDLTSSTTSISSTSLGPSKCPRDPECGLFDNGKNKPYPSDCSKYIHCSRNQEIEIRSCSFGKHFSPANLTCLPPVEALCPLCISEQPTEPTLSPECPPAPSCRGARPGELLPYPPDCEMYLKCSITGTELQRCDEGEHFSPTLLQCLPESEAGCPLCVVLTTPSPPECPPSPRCGPLQQGVTKPYPPDCRKYLYCEAMGVEIITPCPFNQHFSPTKLKCMSREEAGCPLCVPAEEPTTEGTTPSTAPPECPPISQCKVADAGRRLPYPPDCNKYVFCDPVLGDLVESCARRLHFSPSEFFCTSPQRAQCPLCVPGSTTSSTTLEDTTIFTTMEPTTISSTTLPTTIETTPVLTTESPSTTAATTSTPVLTEEPTTVSSTTESTTTTAITTTTESTTILTTPDYELCPPIPTCIPVLDWGRFKPYPPNCRRYIYCKFNGEAKKSTCDKDQHFSPTDLTCMSPEEAGCPECEPAPETTIAPATTPGLPLCEPTLTCPFPSLRTGVYPEKRPYPPDCTKYVYCFGNKRFEGSCQPGQHFSPSYMHCMPPDLAGCPLCRPRDARAVPSGP